MGKDIPATNELTARGEVLSYFQVMKHFAKLLFFAAAFSFTGCVTTPTKPTPQDSFKSADSDGNGKVSRAEFDAHQIGEMFARYDTNNDSVITEREFLNNGGSAEGFRKINTSGTGKITLDEAKASPRVRKSLDATFKEADANGDGSVTMQEFLTARKNALDYVR